MKKQTKLFCLPYAGGSSCSIYNKWKENLDSTIELIPIELAGRGPRIAETLYSNIEEAVNDIIDKIQNELSDCDYAIFGHSMGAILAYKVIQRINELNMPQPIHSFYSGRRAPHCQSRRPIPYSKMNDFQLENEIKELGGTPPEFFDYPELKDIFMPIIKSDFKLADTLVGISEITPFHHDISIFIGTEEDVTELEASEWGIHTNNNFKLEYFNGGHFFLLDNQQTVLDSINSTLTKNYQHVSI